MFVAFNANHYVRFKLTPFGRECHRKNYDEFVDKYLRPKFTTSQIQERYPYRPPKEDESGFVLWQMHKFMEELGRHIQPGGAQIFEMIMEVEVHDATGMSERPSSI